MSPSRQSKYRPCSPTSTTTGNPSWRAGSRPRATRCRFRKNTVPSCGKPCELSSRPAPTEPSRSPHAPGPSAAYEALPDGQGIARQETSLHPAVATSAGSAQRTVPGRTWTPATTSQSGSSGSTCSISSKSASVGQTAVHESHINTTSPDSVPSGRTRPWSQYDGHSTSHIAATSPSTQEKGHILRQGKPPDVNTALSEKCPVRQPSRKSE